MVGQGLVQLAQWWPPSLTTLILIRALQGPVGAAAVPALLTLAARKCPPAAYGRAVARASRAALLGGFAGPLLGGILSQGANLRLPIAVATVLIVGLAVAIAWALARRPPRPGPHRESPACQT
ncbi:MAG: hypothetical protein A3E01_18630 [Gammaproteobacteria bacterium RIFCSPHIGHO2_12_FULL_63_22]|nr:MAG: hypothetical protein A3E01_18630 [Gammaproteobacteria bacterium RIFCSPHIGHO2_12_FULL_63_22]